MSFIKFTNHAFERFSQRYKIKKNIRTINNKDLSIILNDIINDMETNSNSYIEVIENVDNNKKIHRKFVKNRKQTYDHNMFLYKDLQLVLIFNKENTVLITIRLDTGKFKKRRTQHIFKVHEENNSCEKTDKIILCKNLQSDLDDC